MTYMSYWVKVIDIYVILGDKISIDINVILGNIHRKKELKISEPEYFIST